MAETCCSRQRLVHLYRARDDGRIVTGTLCTYQDIPQYQLHSLTLSMLMALSIGLCVARCGQDCKYIRKQLYGLQITVTEGLFVVFVLTFLSDLLIL
jgi:hypothetical protein